MIFLLVFFILLSAFLAASETSLFSLSPTTLKSYKTGTSKGQKRIWTLMSHPRDVLVTLLMLNMLVNILIQNTVANIFDTGNWAYTVAIPLALILVFGEILPKSIAYQRNISFSYFAAPLVDCFYRILKPIRKPITVLTNWISRILFVFLKKEEAITSDELRHVLESSEEKGVLLPEECDLIAGSLDLQESSVKERMRPRNEILYYDIQDPIDQLIHLFVDQETTRVPVCDGDIEKLLGIITSKQFFLHRHEIKTSSSLAAVLKKPYFVPETTRGWTLLKNLRERKESLAVVVDEYGSISGLITQEDLIEAVVGEIKDRRDSSFLYTRGGAGVIIASGKLELSEFEEIFGVALHSKENAVTLAGWLIEQMGDIPTIGAKYSTDQFLFHVLEAEPNRVKRIYVRKKS